MKKLTDFLSYYLTSIETEHHNEFTRNWSSGRKYGFKECIELIKILKVFGGDNYE